MPEPVARVGQGPRAVERLLLEEVDRQLGSARLEPRLLARPLRIVVPSRSLAQHLSVALARRAGRAVLGVSVRTIHAVACDVLARAGVAPPADEGLFELMVRRAARAESALAPLRELEDGHATVVASVRDLLDAGLEPAHADALDEALADEPGDLATRAGAVVRIACAIAREIEADRLGHRSKLFRLAREIVERDPEAALPSRAILIHGFSDATGVVTDLLEALVRRANATLFLDRPPDPAEPSREDPGARFGARFSERVLGAPPPASEAPAPPAEVEVVHAHGPWAEARAVAERLRAALDARELAPEEVGVVARDLAEHRLALRAQLARFAIPYSGLGELGPASPAGRRLADLLALLRDAARARAERWLEALEIDRPGGGRLGAQERADLRIGLHALGASRLGQVAELATAREGEPEDPALPLRAGLAVDDGAGARAPRRRLRRALLDAAIARARDLVARLAALEAPPDLRPLAERAAALREIARGSLGWRDADPGASELEAALAEGALGPPGLAVELEELRLLLARRLAGDGRVPLGGRGGGVQVLTVTEARARSFERLFVVGLARDAFPRAVAEDPLLPDALRARLRALLPDLPRKRDGHDEERFLFAQLVAASPRVVLLASTCDDDGRAREISPLVERLRAPQVAGPRVEPSASARAALAAPGPRAASERALLAGLHAREADFDALLPVALEEAWRGEAGCGVDPAALAAGRIAVLREIDRPAHRGAPLGPYLGFVSGLRAGGDPRRGALAVTTLESLARCPWQTFLAKVLRIEAPPDAGGELPAADPLRLGSLVHRVLERVAKESLGAPAATLAEAAARAPAVVAWPEPEALEEIARETARGLLREEGIALPGFEHVLEVASRDALAVARALDAAETRDGSGIVGAELACELRVNDAAGSPRGLRLRADRVDRRAGALQLTDYKTGKPRVDQLKPESRRAALLEAVAEGELLQGSAYAAAVRAHGPGDGGGRYLYLRADAHDAVRELAVGAGDTELARAFEGAVARALGAWDAGSFFPRLVAAETERENAACRSCLVKEACVRGDSSARGRLVHWADGAPGRVLPPIEAAAFALWRPGGLA